MPPPENAWLAVKVLPETVTVPPSMSKPPPTPVAVLLVKVQPLMFRPVTAQMPPPLPAELPDSVLLLTVTVTVAKSQMAPPSVAEVLPDRVQPLTVRVPEKLPVSLFHP